MKKKNFIFRHFIMLKILTFALFQISCSSEPENEMILVEGGTFMMGCTGEQDDCLKWEKPAHKVTVGSFYISKYEVTVKQWAEVWFSDIKDEEALKAIEELKKVNSPMPNVDFYRAMKFCNLLSEKEGLQSVYKISNMSTDDIYYFDYDIDWNANGYRLPTEAEWEFAARGGNKSKGYKYSGSNDFAEVAWYKENSENKVQTVGQKEPNELGIYDMSGNAYEWVFDKFVPYNKNPNYGSRGEILIKSGPYNILRGGDFNSKGVECRVSNRLAMPPINKEIGFGFRVARNK